VNNEEKFSYDRYVLYREYECRAYEGGHSIAANSPPPHTHIVGLQAAPGAFSRATVKAIE